jgi:tryptophanyl-tRNA synthetase
MSKQIGNHIELALTEKETTAKIMTAVTDPARRYRNDPGHPEVCNVFRLHRYFSAAPEDELTDKCRTAKIGCVECKRVLAEEINTALRPFRERRAKLAENPQEIKNILVDGADRARVIARETIKEVKQKMGLL